MPVTDELDDFLEDLPPPGSQLLFEDSPSESQIAFGQVQELATPTQHFIQPLRQTQLKNEFQLYKDFNKLTYQQCKSFERFGSIRIDPD